MNLNYVGSLAERMMNVSSFIAGTENLESNIFNSISIYVPKSLAVKNLATRFEEPIGTVTPEKYLVVNTVDSTNYNEILAGELLKQWLPVFNNGANIDVTLYIIVFDDSSFKLNIESGLPVWKPLTTAFNDLYFISVFKTLFSEHYDGSKVAEQEEGNYDDSNYFDMALALANLCESEAKLSVALIEAHVVVPTDSDTNACKVLSHTRGEEETAAKTFAGSSTATRAEYFWGFLNAMKSSHTMFYIHNGAFMLPIILGKWFEEKNSSGQYIGNKLAKIRLTGSDVKPTGLPSPLDEAVNQNLASKYYANLDDKFVGYFISIADDSLNNAELIRDRSVSNFPITAYLMSKWIDYTTSQDYAKYVADQSTLTNPVLANAKSYSDIQTILTRNVQVFTGTGRLTNFKSKFPPFAEAKKGNSFKGVGVWTATYIDDLESVSISGSIQF